MKFETIEELVKEREDLKEGFKYVYDEQKRIKKYLLYLSGFAFLLFLLLITVII